MHVCVILASPSTQQAQFDLEKKGSSQLAALKVICEAVPIRRVLPQHKWKCFSNLYIF